mmetsp:Transcript_44529/g.88401  ORF Transcript_44529/g.88401 Transcript_44529/m.88401 type:complete len:211 (+) Transcript_44529:3-635(+)
MKFHKPVGTLAPLPTGAPTYSITGEAPPSKARLLGSAEDCLGAISGMWLLIATGGRGDIGAYAELLPFAFAFGFLVPGRLSRSVVSSALLIAVAFALAARLARTTGGPLRGSGSLAVAAPSSIGVMAAAVWWPWTSSASRSRSCALSSSSCTLAASTWPWAKESWRRDASPSRRSSSASLCTAWTAWRRWLSRWLTIRSSRASRSTAACA